MPLIELDRDPYYSIYYDSDESWLHVDWTGYQTLASESVQRGCERMLVRMVEHKAFRILNDNTNVAGVWNLPPKWLAEDWFPRMYRAGLERFAWIYSPHRASQVTVNATLSHMDADSLNTKVFYDIEEARKWLREFPSRG